MTDRAELLEAALDSLPEGSVLVDAEGRVVFWNRAAAAITGYRGDGSGIATGAGCAGALVGLATAGRRRRLRRSAPGCGSMVRLKHKLGHDSAGDCANPGAARWMGGRIGRAAIFHPAESLDALPHGDCSEVWDEKARQSSRTDYRPSLTISSSGGDAVRCLWITVDQAHDLRKTHGAGACEG